MDVDGVFPERGFARPDRPRDSSIGDGLAGDCGALGERGTGFDDDRVEDATAADAPAELPRDDGGAVAFEAGRQRQFEAVLLHARLWVLRGQKRLPCRNPQRLRGLLDTQRIVSTGHECSIGVTEKLVIPIG